MNAQDLRKRKKRSKKPCYICGKYEIVCEWHHVVSLEEMAALLTVDNELEIEIPLVPLCPTHHSLLHKLKSKSKDKYLAAAELHNDNGIKTREIILMRSKILLELGEFGRVFK